MSAIYLDRATIHSGDLILVNRAHGYQEGADTRLVPLTAETGTPLLRPRAAALLNQIMSELKGWAHILPVSGWRSFEEQQEIWDSSLAESGLEFTRTYVALPGHSEHQTGLAIDLGLKREPIDFIRPDFPYTGICQTFRRRAASYGFVERYPADKESVTGIGHEPWHFRYVGVPHAEIMAREGLVLEEYIAFLRRFPYGGAPYLIRLGGRELAVSFVDGGRRGQTIEVPGAYTISGNNVDGWVLTQWRAAA